MRCLPARAIAASPGIDEEVAEVTPEGKVQMADRLKAMGKLAFAGDRINDAPVPAEATVLSRATMAHIRQNPCWAFACIASLAPVAAGVLFPSFGIPLSPVLAAGAMAMSSVLVLTNALRLKRIGART